MLCLQGHSSKLLRSSGSETAQEPILAVLPVNAYPRQRMSNQRPQGRHGHLAAGSQAARSGGVLRAIGRQVATLEQQIRIKKPAHPAWTGGRISGIIGHGKRCWRTSCEYMRSALKHSPWRYYIHFDVKMQECRPPIS